MDCIKWQHESPGYGFAGFSNCPRGKRPSLREGKRRKQNPAKPRKTLSGWHTNRLYVKKIANTPALPAVFGKPPKKIFAAKSFPKQPAVFGVLASQGL
jgi:hypothetical protein